MDLRYQYANRKVCEVFGRPADEVVGQGDEAFFDARTVAQLHRNDTRVLTDGERVSTEEVNRSLDGLSEHVYFSVKLPLRDARGDIYALCGISTDMTEQKKVAQEIHQLAFYDPLTGLPNRRLLLDHLNNAHAASARSRSNGALVFIDLDNFKVVNDTQGHAQGDQLLRMIAERLGLLLRPHDLLARLSGDEFVVLLRDLSDVPELAAQSALSVAKKLQSALVPSFALVGADHVVTASIGIALFSDEPGNSPDLLRWADMAMYEAKGAGRNAIRFFNPAMQQRAQAQAAILSDMRDALKAQAFVLHYQPQFSTDGVLCGVEALVRWPHPEKGMLPPAQFVQAAEENGFIMVLGDWILHEACRQMALWAAMTPENPWRLAINVSARQFHHPDFVAQVVAALHASGVDPQRIELELTESLLLEDVDNVLARMADLRKLGVSFSLDDFGTGYSSLSYLKSLPIYKLKIDQSFVRDLAHDTNSQAIVRTVVALTQNLELDVIAEGVETSEQHAVLQRLGFHQFQGYLFSRPVPADELQARWLAGLRSHSQ
jgi:diguanylate cyclase (GGDEF)-like protein/PAS domain S-box-containing protein